MQGELSVGYGMRKLLTVVAFITSPVLIGSCSDTPSAPTRLPTVVPTSTVFPTPTAVPEPASLVIEGLSVMTRLPRRFNVSW